MSLILHDAFAGVTPVSVAITGLASKQVAAISATVTPPSSVAIAGQASSQVTAIGATVMPPPDPVDVAIAGMASPQVTSIRSGYPHHRAPAPRLFQAKGSRLVAPAKDPADVLDYTIAYEGLLEPGESIVQSTWMVTGSDEALLKGADLYAPTADATSTTVWLAAGTADTGPYEATNHVVTDHDPPREYERSFSITVVDL